MNASKEYGIASQKNDNYSGFEGTCPEILASLLQRSVLDLADAQNISEDQLESYLT
jgi:hypothetical protein